MYGSILFPSSGGNSLVAKLSSGEPGVPGSSLMVSTSPLTLPQCIPRRICSQKKRPPGDLTRKPPHCPRPQRHNPRRDSGHRPLLWSHPASRVPSSHTGAKNTCHDVWDKRSTTFGRGPAHSRESDLGVDQRPLACLSPSFSPHSPPSSSHSPFSCHGPKNSFFVDGIRPVR